MTESSMRESAERVDVTAASGPRATAFADKPPLPRFPLVSVIILVRNEATRIDGVLNQLTEQDYPADRLEIIVVDGESDDGTPERAARFPAGAAIVKVLGAKERGRAQGLNAGILAASGEVILRMDARTSVDSHYISECVRTLRETGADNVGGVQTPTWKTRRQHAFAMAQSTLFGVGNGEFRYGRRSGDVDSVYLGCFRREVFDTVGLFDTDAAVISEDSDLNFRIRKHGGRVYLNKDIKAYYQPRERFIDLWRLFFRYGGARCGNLVKHRKLMAWRQTVPPVFCLGMFALCALSPFHAAFAIAFLALAGVYLAASSGISLRIAVRERNLLLAPLIVAAFACMHFSYAFGFWRRILVPDRPGTYWDG